MNEFDTLLLFLEQLSGDRRTTIMNDLDNTVWPPSGEKLVHDWRRYVIDEVCNGWEMIPDLGRLAIYLICEQQAGLENWDD